MRSHPLWSAWSWASLAALLSLFASAPSHAAGRGLRVMTYNLYGVACLKQGNPLRDAIASIYGAHCPTDNWYTRNLAARIELIVTQIRALEPQPDLILLQEVYLADSGVLDDEPLRRLPERTGYPYAAWGPPSRVGSLAGFVGAGGIDEGGAVSSGLLILSRHPIEGRHEMTYDLCRDSDCNANPGALHVRLTPPGLARPIDVFNTHLQAFARHETIREQQIARLRAFVEAEAGGGGVILGGDLNLRFDEVYQSDDAFLAAFPGFHEGALACIGSCRFAPGVAPRVRRAQALDHLFHRDVEDGALHIAPLRVDAPHWSWEGRAVSDHEPIVIDYWVEEGRR